MSRPLTTEEFVNRANIVHKNIYDYSKVDYSNNKCKVKIFCKKHGSFIQTAGCHLSGRGCPKCGRIKNYLTLRTTLSSFIERADTIHKNKYDYSQVEYINGITPIKIVCQIHGVFFQTPGNHLRGSGCKWCANNVKLDTKDFIVRSNKIHNNKYDYSQVVYGNNNTEKVKIICNKHGMFHQAPYHHLSGEGCPKCTSNISNKEIQFLNVLNVPNTVDNRQKKILNFKVDGIDFNNNIIYEFLGDYWHGNPKFFSPTDINYSTKTSFGTLHDNTFNKKFKILKENGYKICYIWESGWDIWNKEKNYPIPLEEY